MIPKKPISVPAKPAQKTTSAGLSPSGVGGRAASRNESTPAPGIGQLDPSHPAAILIKRLDALDRKLKTLSQQNGDEGAS